MAKNTKAPKANAGAQVERTERYAEKVRLMFAQTVREMLALRKTTPDISKGVMYSFDGDTQKVQSEVERLLRRLHSIATMAIQKGIELEWTKANDECDKLVSSAFGKRALDKSSKFNAYTQRNAKAMQAFISRSDAGMNLSDRVWRSVRRLRDEMEVALTVSIGEGASSQEISQSVRKYLNDPDLMFRRFRYKDENGNWQRKWKKRYKDEATGKYRWMDYDRDSYIPKRARDRHIPGSQGVYKSSAKNAMRVARTETNMAYRNADWERWQQMDFVLGIHIEPSKHTKKKREEDICDKLSGDYPKSFKFEGWHPQCRCVVTPMVPSDEELIAEAEARGRGEKYEYKQKPIKDFPDNFKSWVSDNEHKILQSRDYGTEPYFLAHNRKAIDRILKGTDINTEIPDQPNADTSKEITIQERRQIILDKAKERHEARTQKQIDDIKRLYWKRWEPSYLTDEQKQANIDAYLKIERELGVKRGRPMNFEQADEMRTNPHFNESEGYRTNCQTATFANELRRRGFDVESLPNTKGSALEELSKDVKKAWIDVKSSIIEAQSPSMRTFKRKDGTTYDAIIYTGGRSTSRLVANINAEIERQAGDDIARFFVAWKWRNYNKGHIITAERIGRKTRFFDPQTGKTININRMLSAKVDLYGGAELFRVDNLAPSAEVAAKVLIKAGEGAKTAAAGKATGISSLPPIRRKQIMEETKRWTERNLQTEVLPNGRTASRLHLNTKDGTEIVMNKDFFKETFAKNKRNNRLDDVMRLTTELYAYISEAVLIREEAGIDHAFRFKVYEVKIGGDIVEFKTKLTNGEILHTMRIK